MKVVSLSAKRSGRIFPPKHPLPPPRKYSCYSFLLEDQLTPVSQCGRKDYVNEKLQLHHRHRTRNLTACSAVPQQNVPPRAPVGIKMCVLIFSAKFVRNISNSKNLQRDIIMKVHRS